MKCGMRVIASIVHIDCNYRVHTELEIHALQAMFTFA